MGICQSWKEVKLTRSDLSRVKKVFSGKRTRYQNYAGRKQLVIRKKEGGETGDATETRQRGIVSVAVHRHRMRDGRRWFEPYEELIFGKVSERCRPTPLQRRR